MLIKEIVDKILEEQKETNAEILEIFKTGSQVLTSINGDKDFVVVCKNYTKNRTKQIVNRDNINYDIIIIDEKAMYSCLDFGDTSLVHKDVKFFNYFFEKNIRETVYGGIDINWSMLEHKEEYLNYIKERYKRTNLLNIKNVYKIGKVFVHYYIVLTILNNNKVEITPKMKLDIDLFYSRSANAEPLIKETFLKMEHL
jgi:hypothetical protein